MVSVYIVFLYYALPIVIFCVLLYNSELQQLKSGFIRNTSSPEILRF